MIKWLVTFLVLWFIYEVREVFPPIIIGAIIAYLLLPVVTQLSAKAKLPIGVATAVVYCTLFISVGILAWYFLPVAVREIIELLNHREEIVSNVISQLATATNWGGDVSAITSQVLRSVTESVDPAAVPGLLKPFAHGALATLVCIVTSIYLTLDSHSVGQFFLRYLPKERRTEAVTLAGKMNRLLSKYVQGQVILIVLMSAVAWVFLHFVMHMKFALPVAILSGFLEIIPVLGPILAITTAVLVGMWQFGPSCAPIIIGFYTIARWIEDYVVVPKLIGHAVELHPLAVIFAVLCGERLAGALGMLIAIPVAACVKLFIEFFYFGLNPEEAADHLPVEPKGPVAPVVEKLADASNVNPHKISAD